MLKKKRYNNIDKGVYVFLVEYRLLGSEVERRQGRLEVRRNGVWGTVCDDRFTDTEPEVACCSLGYG